MSTSPNFQRPTVAILPPIDNVDDINCPSFTREEDYDAYVDSIAPARELVCPITQEIMKDPVVAVDGHTYERSALMRWFSLGRTRSPVTNSIMANRKLFPNLAIQGLAQAHSEKIGQELLNRCAKILENGGLCPDEGARIAALLDAGADTSLRHTDTAATAFLMIILSRNLAIARTFLHYEAPVLLADRQGLSCLGAAQSNAVADSSWRTLVEELRKQENIEKDRAEARDEARSRANQEHRTQQMTLATTMQSRNSNNMQNVRGLGDLEDGWGYFPSLVALQFQSSIPPPTSSIAVLEREEKQRLSFILRMFSVAMLILWILT